MNNVSTDEVLKRPLSSVENGSIKKNSRSTSDSIDKSRSSKAGSVSKNNITTANNTNTDNNTEDGEGSEAETVVMPGKDLDSTSSKRTIRHEANVDNNNEERELKNSGSNILPNGSATRLSRSARQEGATTWNEKKIDKSRLSPSSHNSPLLASSSSHDPHQHQHQNQHSHQHQQDQQHHSSSRSTSESTKSRHDNNESSKLISANPSRKRKVSIDGTDDKPARRRIKREDNDIKDPTESRKSVGNGRSESPSRQRASTHPSNSPSVQKPRRKPPPPLVVGASGKRKQSPDGHSNESQSPKHSGHPRPTSHTADSEMLKKRRDKNGRTRVARACAVDNFEEVREHLKDHPEELDEADNAGNTPLQIASLEGNTDIVKLLLKKGCKVDTENCDRDSPLIDSVENSHLAVVKLLLEAGVNPRKVNAKGEEPSDLVDLDHDDGPAIKEELIKYRLKYDSKRRQSTEKGPDTGRESVSIRSPRGSPTFNARSPPPQTTRRRAGRSEVTRNDLLWITATQENLVNFAGKGDDQAIIHLLNMRPISDVEAVFAAAKGGHESCLNLLLAMGTTEADPAPLEDQKKGYNTPMLAAIGKGSPRIIELLLEQPGFDPTKRLYKNLTYFEIAEKRQGDGWREEHRTLKAAYSEKMALDGKKSSAKSSRTSSPKDSKKANKDRSPSSVVTRDYSPSTSKHSLTRKKPSSEVKSDRPRDRIKDHSVENRPERKHLKVPKQESREVSNAISDREASPIGDKGKRSMSDHESVPRPRKRLISGRDLKDAQTKHRRSSFVSNVSASSAPDFVRVKSSPDEANKIKRPEGEGKSEKKKLRRSLSPHPSDHTPRSSGSTAKRSRISSDSIISKSTGGPAKVMSMTRNVSSNSVPVASSSLPSQETKNPKLNPKARGAIEPSKEKDSKDESDSKSKSRIKEKSLKSVAIKVDVDRRKSKEAKPDEDKPRLSQINEIFNGTADTANVGAIKQEITDSPTKEFNPGIKHTKIASRTVSPDPSVINEDDAETAPTESGSIIDTEKLTPQSDKMAFGHDEASNERKRLRHQEEEASIEEAERCKRKREDEETLRRQAALEQKQKLERERYLQTLPRVFRDLIERPEQAMEPKEIRTWLPLLCATGGEIDPGCPEAQKKDLWITNFQVCAILVESDLEMSHYTAWTRKPLVDPLKDIVWRNLRSTIHRWSILDSTDIMRKNHAAESHDAYVICATKFLALDNFWIRLSDFEDVAPRYPHLHGLKWNVKVLSPIQMYQDVYKKIDEAEKLVPKSVWANLLPTPRPTQSPIQSTEASSALNMPEPSP